MADLMDEVGDDLRQQELKAFWQENKAWVIGGVIAAILATGAMSFWRNYEYKQNVASTTALLEAAKLSDVEKISAFAKSGDKDHAVVARFLAAGLYLQQDNKDMARALYADIEKTSGIDAAYRDLAALYGVRLDLESGDPDALHKRIDKLTGKNDVWRFSAMEAKALLFAREGKMKEAATLMEKISGDAQAPSDVRTRASTLRELYLGESAQGRESN